MVNNISSRLKYSLGVDLKVEFSDSRIKQVKGAQERMLKKLEGNKKINEVDSVIL